jgi:hypothetical protein
MNIADIVQRLSIYKKYIGTNSNRRSKGMCKGRKVLGGVQNKCDNSGDGILELRGKGRKDAKERSNRIIRRRLKRMIEF